MKTLHLPIIHSKITPAPWRVNPIEGYQREVRVLTESGSKKVICVANSSPLFSRGEAEANAKLISAAPELLQVLIDIRDWVAHPKNNVSFNPIILADMFKAIEKATS